MALSVPREAASTVQYQPGYAGIYQSVRVPNGNTVYEVYSARDKHDLDSYNGGISVVIGGKEVATLECRSESIVDNIDGINLRVVE